ncbi:MAG: hypothetical protein H6Q90_4144 [Deltaproteobacteria bacterium]|nr:hypothetical protein [Deltaproteobacteria bacterium]
MPGAPTRSGPWHNRAVSPLRPVLDELERGHERRALELALAVWREGRDPVVADVVDAISARVARPYHEMMRPWMKGYERSRRWRHVEAARDPLDLPALLVGARSEGADVVTRLEQWEDDPRIAAWIVKDTDKLWGADVPAAQRLLVRLADRRGVPALAAAGPPWSDIARKINEASDSTPLDETAVAISALLVRRRVAEDEHAAATLLRIERVLDDPADLAERLVLSDWLLDHGDPRGELIALQLGRPSRANALRVRELLRRHASDWLEGLSVWGGEHRFVAGFLDSCTYDVRRNRHASPARGWATVRHVQLLRDGEHGCTFVPILPHAPRLYTIWNAAPPTVRALAAGARPEVRRLSFALDAFARSERPIVAALEGLPLLRHLQLGRCTPSSWIVGGPAWRRVEVVSIIAGADQLGGWLDLFAKPVSARIRSLRMRASGRTHAFFEWTYRITRPAHLTIIGVTKRGWPSTENDPATALVTALRSVRSGSLDRVTVHAQNVPLDAAAAELARIRR